jgi:outer membrane lipoprotein-sorting protein
MRFKVICFLFFLLVNIKAVAQNDTEAIKILDKFAETAQKAPSVFMRFRLINTNQAENSKDTLQGSVLLNKDRYRLELPDNIVWFNGQTSWSYLPVENEVTITKANKKDNTFESRPSLIFTMYRKGYKNRLIEDKTNACTIDLYPEDLKSDLLRIRLTIGKPALNLISLEYRRKDGVIALIQVQEYNLKQKPEADTFIFQPAKYKDAEIIDMR